jgi:hypothetical protein
MGITFHGMATRAILLIGLAAIALGVSGCSAHFCAGSGCDNGKIYFGSNVKQQKKSGDLSIVGKANDFKLSQNVAFVAYLTEAAGVHSITLKVTCGSHTKSTAYPVRTTGSNEVAHILNAADLQLLGITAPGKCTFFFKRGSKQLAKGSMTEK